MRCERCGKRHKGKQCPNGKPLLGLPPRQAQMVRLLCEGRSNPDIAREMGVDEGTVKRHLTDVYDRCGLGSRAEAIVRFLPILLNDRSDKLEAERDALLVELNAARTALSRERKLVERLAGMEITA